MEESSRALTLDAKRRPPLLCSAPYSWDPMAVVRETCDLTPDAWYCNGSRLGTCRVFGQRNDVARVNEIPGGGPVEPVRYAWMME